MRRLSDEQIREFVEDWYNTKSVEDVFGLSSVAEDVRELLGDADEDTNREEALRVVDALLKRGDAGWYIALSPGRLPTVGGPEPRCGHSPDSVGVAAVGS